LLVIFLWVWNIIVDTERCGIYIGCSKSGRVRRIWRIGT